MRAIHERSASAASKEGRSLHDLWPKGFPLIDGLSEMDQEIV
jgi:hypothetical protein